MLLGQITAQVYNKAQYNQRAYLVQYTLYFTSRYTCNKQGCINKMYIDVGTKTTRLHKSRSSLSELEIDLSNFV